MTKRDFNIQLVDAIRTISDEGTEIRYHSVPKNNGVNLDAVTILKPGRIISPTIYTDAYYDQYCDGKTIRDLAQDVLVEDAGYELPDVGDMEEYMRADRVKERLRFRVINYEKNRKMLKDVPHRRFLDLAVIYYQVMEVNHRAVASCIIKYDDMDDLNLTEEELHDIAEKNTVEHEKPGISLLKNLLEGIVEEPEDEDDEFYTKLECIRGMILVLTNESRFYGASCMLYPDLIKRTSEALECGLYILPCSIHEVLLLPDKGFFTRGPLEAMVREVNREALLPTDVLSDRVYYYSRYTGTIMM